MISAAHRRASTSQGYALVLVLGLLALLGTMAISLGTATQMELAQTRRFQDEAAAALLAKAGIEWSMAYVQDMARQDTLWQAPWSTQPTVFHGRPLGPGVFDVRYSDAQGVWHHGLQDEEARVNLNTAPVALLAALPGVDQALAQRLVAQRPPAGWQTPEAVLHAGLVPPALWHSSAGRPGLSAYVTVWGSGKINVNTASAAVLAAVPGLAPAMVEALLRYRAGADQQEGTSDDQHFRTLADVGTLPELGGADVGQLTPWCTVTPSAFRLVATGRVQPGAGPGRQQHRLAIIEQSAQRITLRHWQPFE